MPGRLSHDVLPSHDVGRVYRVFFVCLYQDMDVNDDEGFRVYIVYHVVYIRHVMMMMMRRHYSIPRHVNLPLVASPGRWAGGGTTEMEPSWSMGINYRKRDRRIDKRTGSVRVRKEARKERRKKRANIHSSDHNYGVPSPTPRDPLRSPRRLPFPRKKHGPSHRVGTMYIYKKKGFVFTWYSSVHL